MNREDIIRVMRESGMTFHLGLPFEPVVDQMQRVADLIVFEASVKSAKMLAEGLEEARAAEREKVAAWMIQRSYATGHGDTTEDLLKELDWQIAERIAAEREARAKECEHTAVRMGSEWMAHHCAAIRARGQNL